MRRDEGPGQAVPHRVNGSGDAPCSFAVGEFCSPGMTNVMILTFNVNHDLMYFTL